MKSVARYGHILLRSHVHAICILKWTHKIHVIVSRQYWHAVIKAADWLGTSENAENSSWTIHNQNGKDENVVPCAHTRTHDVNSHSYYFYFFFSLSLCRSSLYLTRACLTWLLFIFDNHALFIYIQKTTKSTVHAHNDNNNRTKHIQME